MPEAADSDLVKWLEDLEGKVRQLLDSPTPMTAQAKFDELMKMSGRLLALSRSFLALATTASDAAASLLEPQAGQAGEPIPKSE
jgi:hypothetical protein